jgi:hypothetical protein
MEKLKEGTVFTIGATNLKRRVAKQDHAGSEKIFIEVLHGSEWISGYISLATFSVLQRSGKIHIVT